MKLHLVSALVFGLTITTFGYAQNQNPGPPDNSGMGLGSQPVPGGQDAAGGQMGPGGMRGGMGMGMMGRGVEGTVTEVAPDHYTIKTLSGETYTIHYSANTRIMKQSPGMRGGRGMRGGMGMGGMRQGSRGGGNPPQPIKASEIKVGDAIASMGEVDASARSVGAMGIVLLDPERAKEMAQMQADYGKTWLMGRVTAIDGVKVTLMGGVDSEPHAFVANENTIFRKRRDPITLGDIRVGDMVRVDGSLKDGVFTAASVHDMGAPGEARGPRGGPPAQ